MQAVARQKFSGAASFVDVGSGVEPAREVRLYHYGWNTTTKGELWFDQAAAESVMGAFHKHGVAGMIDLEHLSLDESSPSFDPDARGAYDLEVRPDAQGRPELWLVAKWAPDGVERIAQRRQRYLSPVVFFSTKTRRILDIYNVALVANPATDHAQPLIAASARGSASRPVDPIAAAVMGAAQRSAHAARAAASIARTFGSLRAA